MEMFARPAYVALRALRVHATSASRRAIVFALAMMAVTLPALAQETKTVWTLYSAYPSGYNSEKAVQLAIQSQWASSTPADARWIVLSTKTTESETEYHYGIESVPIIKGSWHYSIGYAGDNYENYPEDDQALIAGLVAEMVSACGAGTEVQVTPESPWENAQVVISGVNGEPMTQMMDYYIHVPGDPSCTAGQRASANVWRQRTLECSQKRIWDVATQMCKSRISSQSSPSSYFSKLVAKSDQCLGNPCDPTTGDKHETATDFELGWIAFVRHFHSLIGNSTPGFGAGWSHEHAVRVNAVAASDGSLTVSYIDPQGFQIPFACKARPT